MRVALVAETFLPQMNGVVNSVIQVLRHLESRGHEAVVVAPRGTSEPDAASLHGADISALRSVAAPGYPEVRLTFATAARIGTVLREAAPDVVHLASPFFLGWQALRAAEQLGIPSVAVYQTDIPGYAKRYGYRALAPALDAHVARIHGRATLNLAPSSASIGALDDLGVGRVRLWARGVDGERFHPSRRSDALRRSLAPNGELLVGYVGRLAPEKQVEDLAALAGIPGTRLVVVGDGPSRAALERLLPDAAFLGFRSGEDLARAVASFDVFVHPGENETFCQTIQEALASGVPVVATGRGGPLDLVESSRTGWLYRPGDLDDLRARVRDLVGDEAKRRAFSAAARASVAHRTWTRLGDQLLGHYADAIAIRAGRPVEAAAPPVEPGLPPAHPPRWHRFVALGDSLTEGLSDSSRQAPGEFRGWADRLATYLARSGGRTTPLHYANLGVRSRRIADVVTEQIPRAIELRADLVAVLVGANDLAGTRTRPEAAAERLGDGIRALRASGADVLIVTPFAPVRWYLRGVDRRFARFGAVLRRIARETGSMLLDFRTDPVCHEQRAWADDRVHLSSHGHRVLSYRAAEVLGIPGALEVGALDIAMHAPRVEPSGLDQESEPGMHDAWIRTLPWLRHHMLPWALRRLRGRTAGEGLGPKHTALIQLPTRSASPSAPTRT
ncbi:MAG TPA: glycosyltransferase [Microbacteriaceae bacterium]|nr:glycosyltransferase [Microbacteriaceae bacterium]